MANEIVTLQPEQAEDIREALLIGLSMYGDLLERENAVEILRRSNEEVPESLIPLHPTGTCDVATTYSNALRAILDAERASKKEDGARE